MFEYIPVALTNLKAAKDILMTIQDLRDFDKITTATKEIKERLIETIDSVLATKEQFLTFQDKITELEKENARLKEWFLEKQRYERRQIAPGVFTQVEKDFTGELETAHKLCQNCFNKAIPSTLQQERNIKIRHYVLVCPNGCPSLTFKYYIDQIEEAHD
jgi:hypothetical protein